MASYLRKAGGHLYEHFTFLIQYNTFTVYFLGNPIPQFLADSRKSHLLHYYDSGHKPFLSRAFPETVSDGQTTLSAMLKVQLKTCCVFLE